MHIRSNDQVEVIAGADKGTRAKVLRVLASREKVVVEGVGRVQKHMRRSQQNPRGGRLSQGNADRDFEHHADLPGLRPADANRRSHAARTAASIAYCKRESAARTSGSFARAEEETPR